MIVLYTMLLLFDSDILTCEWNVKGCRKDGKGVHAVWCECRLLAVYVPLLLVLLLFGCLFVGVAQWMLTPSQEAEQRIQEMAAQRLSRMGMDL